MSARTGGQLEFLNQIREKTITVTEQEACVAGDIAIAAGTDVIPFSSLDNLSATIIGTELDTVVGGNDPHMAIDWIYDNIAVSAYSDADSTNDGTLTPIRLNADGTKTVGSNFVFDSGTVEYIDITGVNNGRFIIGFEESATNNVEARGGQVDFETLYITFGATLVVEAVDTNALALTDIRDDAGVMIYNDSTNSDGNLIAMSLNSSTLALTKGAIASIGTGAISYPAICKIDTDKIGCGYRDAGAGNDGFSNIATVATVTLTVGADTEFSNNDNAAFIGICAMSATLISAIYTENGVTGDVLTNAATISGVTPTWGTPQVTTESTDIGTAIDVIRWESTTFMALYDNDSDNKTVFAICTVSGNTVTVEKRRRFANKLQGYPGKALKINSFNDIVFFSTLFTSVTYATFLDRSWQDGTYVIDNVLGVAKDSAGTIIINGIDEGNASGQDPATSIFIDMNNRCVRIKNHSCQYPGYLRKIEVVAPDAYMVI